MDLDLDFVRAQFPAFAAPALQGQAFFENAGGSYACQPVIDRLTRFYVERKVQPHAPFAASAAGGAEMEAARSRLAGLLGVGPEELSFGPSTSQNTYVLAQAFREWLSPGDAVIVTDQDHEANSGVWRRLARDGIEVREWRMNRETGALETEGLATLLDGAVRLVCFPHCSNVVGQINPVTQWCRLIREAGAVSCVDGVSYAPHGFPHVPGLGADFYMFSAYKTYGPHLGILTIRRELARRLPVQGHWFNAASLPDRFTPAGPDHAQIAACAGMVDYVERLAAHHGVAPGEVALLMARQESSLLQPLLDWAATKNSVRLLGPAGAEGRAPTVALALDEPGEAAAARLARHGIMAGGGDFYAGRALSALGVAPELGVLRLSFVHYTSQAEVNRLIAALEAEL